MGICLCMSSTKIVLLLRKRQQENLLRALRRTKADISGEQSGFGHFPIVNPINVICRRCFRQENKDLCPASARRGSLCRESRALVDRGPNECISRVRLACGCHYPALSNPTFSPPHLPPKVWFSISPGCLSRATSCL
jgi:hypothetical protein